MNTLSAIQNNICTGLGAIVLISAGLFTLTIIYIAMQNMGNDIRAFFGGEEHYMWGDFVDFLFAFIPGALTVAFLWSLGYLINSL